MSELTPNLSLPYIFAAQAQKHVTHNEALQALDTLVHLAVHSEIHLAPETHPNDGERYLVASGGVGLWAGQEGNIAAWQDGVWTFLQPREGWTCWISDPGEMRVFSNGVWISLVEEMAANNEFYGVNTVADGNNRLAVKSNSILFGHDDVTPGSGDIRLMLNKSSSTNIGSILFQDDYVGRAEIGLVGEDNLTIRTTNDGSDWNTAMTISKQTGGCTFGTTSQTSSLTTYGPLFIEDTANENPYLRLNDGSAPAFIELAGGEFRLNAKGSTMDFTMFAGNDLSLRCEHAGDVRVFRGALKPDIDGGQDLGTSDQRWDSIWAVNSVVQTSDRALKRNIVPLNLGLDFINELKPVRFCWSSPEVGGESNLDKNAIDARVHLGLVVQDVEEALAVCDAESNLSIVERENGKVSGLRYNQFIAVLIQGVQELSNRLLTLEGEAIGGVA